MSVASLLSKKMIRVVVVLAFMALTLLPSLSQTVSAASSCTRADPTKCLSSGECTNAAGNWFLADRNSNAASCLPDPKGCNGSYLSNCTQYASQCQEAGGTFTTSDSGTHCASKVVATAPTTVTQATQSKCDTSATFFGLVPWYRYLTLVADASTNDAGNCKITNFDNSSQVLGKSSPFLLIGLAILDDLIRVAALVAVGFVIYGGIQYITSQGSPDSTKQAQQTIINALIGLVVAMAAVGLVSFIGTKLGGA